MKFVQLGRSDARLIELTVRGDERGSFTRTWCAKTFAAEEIDFQPVQGNSSVTRHRGTVRGMHFQRAPKADAKIVRCTAGLIHDVIVDVRPTSATRGEVYACELGPSTGRMLYIPAGFAHGFQTLTDDVTVEYLMGIDYVEELSDGFRHNDPLISIKWPGPVTVLSAKDAAWPLLAERPLW
ncbi:putative dTDP-4-dehydrorhamnose 3,5-epimerase (dTDP-4-keto-6-deoxyglucose 3,5-epimerase) (dTDP-L-rhamnose synthetase), (rfbC-like) [Bradyrhizobium sp. ORS 278]|uniref:dTDP-4-dehydrorhamnose 3,5-epimerase family protein n=1 Tax=Bradyrhizobium sp. (strain ORS 278) TaxID=114615 RepID=UPI00015088AC|nr:dTDP-4-dehydrorhamnose 3,5-epimerase family protein [Bradyrhizobium sp. ORS 278]CAL78556.1 putative dTDP-4-dehydrorhamnose 3,5-epimerase (dTDP-4-keto-6-deoxyglucose 3,5-epimerase) (dTDP-L-rhamnose synthetase), (rfbC-like) [Bradyrhizobium sp. ORS 278]